MGNTFIKPRNSAKNLGVIFDKHLSIENHITSVCKSANYQLRNISQIRPYLNEKSAAQRVHSFISSRLDYCNSLLIGLPHSQINRLQRIQNNAARIVSKTKKFEHISPVLDRLHWLCVQLLLTYRCINNISPSYLSDLLLPYQPVCSFDHQNITFFKFHFLT